MIWIPHIILIGFNLVNVFIDAYKIKKLNKTIRHGINLAAYLATAGIAAWYFHMNLWHVSIYLLSAFFNRQITFDIPLNWRRGLKWDYVSLDKPPKALMDKIEVRVFGYNGRLPALIYGICWICTLVIQYFL